MTRTTDTHNEKFYFQTGRFVQQNGEWFYTTREIEERGPFTDIEDAKEDLDVYISYQNYLKKS